MKPGLIPAIMLVPFFGVPFLLPTAATAHVRWFVEDGNDQSTADNTISDPAVWAWALSGWNVLVSTRHFAFAPEMVNKDNVPQHGHAYLYVTEQKFARLYGPAVFIADLPEGQNIILVRLNANDHSDLVLNGQPIAADVVVPIPAVAETANHAVPGNTFTNYSIETKG